MTTYCTHWHLGVGRDTDILSFWELLSNDITKGTHFLFPGPILHSASCRGCWQQEGLTGLTPKNWPLGPKPHTLPGAGVGGWGSRGSDYKAQTQDQSSWGLGCNCIQASLCPVLLCSRCHKVWTESNTQPPSQSQFPSPCALQIGWRPLRGSRHGSEFGSSLAHTDLQSASPASSPLTIPPPQPHQTVCTDDFIPFIRQGPQD